MTWTFAAFAILFGALAAGFAWYERSRPTSRILALVATLAALAALGRIAFAPLPNIKPTTDIVVLAGFALGAAPGFAVGATAALTSNLFFGQGPWTPWQMVGWGLCGVLGALLARATRGDANRWQLAATCALAGGIYGVLLDVHDWLVYAPQQTAAQYAVVAGTSLPFNLAHIAGNVVFAATLGPALLRILTRFRARCQIDWRPLAPAAAALLAALVVLQAAPPPAQASVSSDALRFLERLRVAEQHAVVGVVLVEERIVDAGVAGGHAALHHDRGLGLPHFEHRHAGDRAGRIVLRAPGSRCRWRRSPSRRRCREVVVDLVHLEHDVVGHLGLGEQHVHVARHAAGDRMDAEAHVDALLAQQLGDLEHRVLRLRHRHAVAGHDDHVLRVAQQLGGLDALIGDDLARRLRALPPRRRRRRRCRSRRRSR
jgi:energy-coupling factor transport system substrate-specific component